MMQQDLYQLILHGQSKQVIEAIADKSESELTPRDMCLRALAYLGIKDIDNAEETLGKVDLQQCDDETKSIYYEAEMLLLGSRTRKPPPEYKTFVKKALEFNSRSYFAQRATGRIAEVRRDYAEALRRYEIALELAPERDQAKLDVARILIEMSSFSQAREMIKRTRLSPQRAIYHFQSYLARFRYLLAYILLFAFFILNPRTSFAAAIILVGLGIVNIWYGLRIRDILILKLGISHIIMFIALMILKPFILT